jgi:murein DD-endopeptidase MepM/ murein hydrolase activator NlpD
MVAFALFAGSCVPPLPPAAAAPPPPKSPLLRPEMSGGGPAIVPAPTPEPTATISGITLIGTPMQGAIVQGIAPRGVLNLTLDGAPVRVAPDGVFIIGFGRDAPPRSVLRATSPQVRAIEVPLTVAPRAWQIETIASVPRFAQPSAEFARLRGPELAQINAARRIDAASDGWRQHFIWPVTGRISGLFGSQRVYANGEKGDPHSGVDIARPAGTPVVSPADGVVILAADHPFTLEGNLLMIDHGMGLNSAFLHLSRIDVKVGDRVRQGQPVGAIGMTGRASGPHLHWSMKWQDRRVDPLLVAGPMG